MPQAVRIDGMKPRSVVIGGVSRQGIEKRLAAAGVELNDYARMLLAHQVFDSVSPAEQANFASFRVQDLGIQQPATLKTIFDLAMSQGLALCPASAGPFLRLATMDQQNSTNSILSAGKKPANSLAIASLPLGTDDFPKGFYLRVVDGVPWLRGYRCEDAYEFAPEDAFIFQIPGLG
ncbi:hypothetical protein [Glutamicibacter protophormiae]